MPIKRATSRVHKGGGGPPARRAVGGATSKDQLVQLKQQLQDLGEENRNLKVRKKKIPLSKQILFFCSAAIYPPFRAVLESTFLFAATKGANRRLAA